MLARFCRSEQVAELIIREKAAIEQPQSGICYAPTASLGKGMLSRLNLSASSRASIMLSSIEQ